MQYALSHVPLVKIIGGQLIVDSIHATSKSDLTPEAYAAHKRHQSAPSPLSAREQEIADLRAAEAQASTYNGSRSRQSPVGTGVGLKWTEEVEAAVRELGDSDASRIVILVWNDLYPFYCHLIR
jgi:twinfilin-like protein